MTVKITVWHQKQNLLQYGTYSPLTDRTFCTQKTTNNKLCHENDGFSFRSQMAKEGLRSPCRCRYDNPSKSFCRNNTPWAAGARTETAGWVGGWGVSSSTQRAVRRWGKIWPTPMKVTDKNGEHLVLFRPTRGGGIFPLFSRLKVPVHCLNDHRRAIHRVMANFTCHTQLGCAPTFGGTSYQKLPPLLPETVDSCRKSDDLRAVGRLVHSTASHQNSSHCLQSTTVMHNRTSCLSSKKPGTRFRVLVIKNDVVENTPHLITSIQ